MQRVGRDVGILSGAYGMPFAHCDLAVVAAAGDARGATLLLPAIHLIRELVVGDHVVELRRRLVVPGTPGAAVIHADGGPLVAGQQDDVGVVGIDPDGMVVVAAGGALDGGEGLPGVGRSIRTGIGDVDDVLVLGVDAHPGEVRSATVDPLLAV